MANLHCECQELKPKGETNSSFLVFHSSSGVNTVKTVGSHLKHNLQIFQAFLTTTLVALKTARDRVLKIRLNPQFKIMHKFRAQSNLD